MYNLGSCCFELKKFDEAIPFFDESLFIDEAHVKSLTKRAKCLYYCDLFEDCIIDCNELNRICPSDKIKQLQYEANLSKTRRGEPSLNYLLGVRRNCDPAEMLAAYETYLEMYNPVKRLHPNKLKGHQHVWRYEFVKSKFEQFKINQNLAMDESD